MFNREDIVAEVKRRRDATGRDFQSLRDEVIKERVRQELAWIKSLASNPPAVDTLVEIVELLVDNMHLTFLPKKEESTETVHSHPLVGELARAVPNTEEQEALDHLIAFMRIVQGWGLSVNTGELATGVHMLQQFVVQHLLQRLEPTVWSNWYKEISDEAC